MNRKIRKVIDMCITEYNEEETLQAIVNEKFAEGRAVRTFYGNKPVC